MAHGWDFTAKQTESSTGQRTHCWAAITSESRGSLVHGNLVNRGVDQAKSVATSTLQAPEKESGMTGIVNRLSQP